MTVDSPSLSLALAPSKQIPVGDFLELAQHADRLGYHSLWIPETWGPDSVSLLAAVACQTERIKIASGVFNVYSRSPALIAQTAATLQELSHGRFILGLGASGPVPVERWHGVPYGSPLDRTRAAISIIRRALSGALVDLDTGDIHLSGFRLSNPPLQPIPLFLAALGPRNTRLAGELADGWLPIFLPRDSLHSLRVPLALGADGAGRLSNDIQIGAFLPGLVSQRGESLLRHQLAYYIGGMGSFYREFVRRLGFEDDAEMIGRLWSEGKRREAADHLTPALLDRCTLGSVPFTVRERLKSYTKEGVHVPILSIPTGATTEEIATTLETLRP